MQMGRKSLFAGSNTIRNNLVIHGRNKKSQLHDYPFLGVFESGRLDGLRGSRSSDLSKANLRLTRLPSFWLRKRPLPTT